MEEDKIEQFLEHLRNSADIIHNIFMTGSCFRLFLMLKSLYPEAEAYWSDRDSHTLTYIDNKFYDIGGKVSKEYVEKLGYKKMDEEDYKGAALLGYTNNEDARVSVWFEKYRV